jgi:hypothetical protein
MAKDSVIAIKPEILLVELPPVPDWFERELSQVGQRNGHPMFRIVDGQRETKFRNGKWDVKHLLQHDNVPAYVPVVRQVFRRKNKTTGEYQHFSTFQQAQEDQNAELGELEYTNLISVRGVGRACWVVEVYIDPDELGYEAWEASRYADLQTNGVVRRVDMFGPFPREGMYMYCFSVVDEEGDAISPNRRTIEECQRRWHQVTTESATLEQTLLDVQDREEKFQRKQISRISDNFYQYHGVAARRLHHGVTGKPITKVYE